MLHIKRDPKTGVCLYRLDKDNKHSHSDTREQNVCIPTVHNPQFMSFKKWYDLHTTDVCAMVDVIMNHVYNLQSDRYIIKITEDDSFHMSLAKWIYAHSENKNKHYV
jgi:esterase/lipase